MEAETGEIIIEIIETIEEMVIGTTEIIEDIITTTIERMIMQGGEIKKRKR